LSDKQLVLVRNNYMLFLLLFSISILLSSNIKLLASNVKHLEWKQDYIPTIVLKMVNDCWKTFGLTVKGINPINGNLCCWTSMHKN
jgi:hypothetical protein